MKFIKQYKEALSMELREHRSSFLCIHGFTAIGHPCFDSSNI